MKKQTVVSVVIVIVFTILVMGCATDSSTWKKASKTNTIEAMNKYLEKYPDGEFAKMAREQKQQLIEYQEYLSAEERNTPQAWRSYVDRYPNGYYIDKAKRKFTIIEERDYRRALSRASVEGWDHFIMTYYGGENIDKAKEQRETQLWRDALSPKDIDGYKEYLKQYPDGRYAQDAKNKIKKLLDQAAWKKALAENTIESYRHYLEQYPKGEGGSAAQVKINTILDEAAWKKALAVSTISAYQEFIKKFPNSKYIKQARSKKEELVWSKAKQTNTFESYAGYLNEYPRGKYKKEAQIEIPKYFVLSDAELDKVSKAIAAGEKWTKNLDVVQKLIFTGASLINEQANWTNRVKGRVVYDNLKMYTSKKLGNAMYKVVQMEINRLRVLFLVVKMGVPGTQEPLNDLLLQYGTKSMAEDYLNSGSKELFEGGKAWANARGYTIMSGFGSGRVGWGRF